MVCKVLFFDYRKSEELFFEKNKLDNFDIKFFDYSLNRKNIKNLTAQDLEQANAISIYTPSIISQEILEQFKNLLIVATRSKDIKHIDLKACLERNIAVVNVDSITADNEYKILHESFKGITSILCGCKEYRVV